MHFSFCAIILPKLVYGEKSEVPFPYSNFAAELLQTKKLDDYPHHKLSHRNLLTNVLYEAKEGLREGYRPSGQMCLHWKLPS